MKGALLGGGIFLEENNMAKQLIVNIEQKFYKNSKIKILEDCRFRVKPGEFVTILGASGCGKSTLLKLIVGIDDDCKGDIILGKRKVRRPSKDCSIIFQEARLLPWMSVYNNVKYAVKSKPEGFNSEIANLLSLLDLSDFENEYPVSLSGGMSQKVALARALINIPDLLLLDEPFASLDYITRMQLQQELMRLLAEARTTVLMVTHDIEEALFCSDRILIMSRKPGKIVATFDVDLPKPRNRASDEFLALYKKILSYMIEELRLI